MSSQEKIEEIENMITRDNFSLIHLGKLIIHSIKQNQLIINLLNQIKMTNDELAAKLTAQATVIGNVDTAVKALQATIAANPPGTVPQNVVDASAAVDAALKGLATDAGDTADAGA